jgi:hypothetical protein
MRYRCILFVLTLGSTLFWRCTLDTDVTERGKILPPEYSDPYLNSFRNKNIHYIVIYDKGGDTRTDTIELDRKGDIIKTKRFWRTERRAYDSAGFCIRLWQNSDITGNYHLKHSIKEDTLIQWRREYNSDEWAPMTDTSTHAFVYHGTEKFVFDESGRVTFEYWDQPDEMTMNQGRDDEMIRYVYSKDKLIERELYTFQNSKYELSNHGVWRYSYDKKSELSKIETVWGFRYETYWLSNGLIDSTLEIDKHYSPPSRDGFEYRYIYFPN